MSEQIDFQEWFEGRKQQYAHLSGDSEKQYLNKYANMLRKEAYPEDVSRTRKSFESNRAAFIYGIFKSIETKPEEKDRLFNEALPYMNGTKIWSNIDTHKTKKHSNSKKRLSKLPNQWKHTLFNRATVRAKKVLAVLELIGCRPVAFTDNGVSIEYKKGVITAIFNPGKRDEVLAKGHDFIKVRLKPNLKNPRVAWLVNYITRFENGQMTIIEKNAKSLVFALSKRVFPRRMAKTRPSAYSYRHDVTNKYRFIGFK